MFDVPAQAYGRFMGRYSRPLAELTAQLAGVRAGQRALDVGCGPGALTGVLVDRLGAGAVVAVDPSPSFVGAVAEQLPGVEVHHGTAEDLAFADGSFDVTLAQLVVHFMTDPVRGLAQMSRVTAPGGVVAANVWDYVETGGPLGVFWAAAREQDPAVVDETHLPGVGRGDLHALFERAGMDGATETTLTVEVEHASFEEWWEPFTFGVGPAGALVAALPEQARVELRERCRGRLPAAPFTISATAWAALWHKPVTSRRPSPPR